VAGIQLQLQATPQREQQQYTAITIMVQQPA